MKSNAHFYYHENANIVVGMDDGYVPYLQFSDGENIILIHGIDVESMQKAGGIMSRIREEIELARQEDDERKSK